MAGRERYYLQRDEAQSRRDIRESEERAARSRGGINLSRGIGRGLGLLAGLALAPATAGTSMLALAGGLGSLGGSLAGRAYGKDKYGGPEKANVGLFNRDVAREQRKGVDQYWRGVKEQTVTNTLQDAITAAMYGSKIKDFMAGTPKAPVAPSTPVGGELASSPEMIGDLAVPDMPTQDVGISSTAPPVPAAPVDTSAAASQYSAHYPSVPSPEMLPDEVLTNPNLDFDFMNISPEARTLNALSSGSPINTTPIDASGVNLNGMNPDGSFNLSGKSPLFSQQSIGSGNPNFLGDAVNNTDLRYDTKMRDRILDYMHPSKNWAPDHTIDMNMWDQIANAQNIQMPSILGRR